MIRNENGKFVVYSESGRKFGEYSTEKEAKNRIRQMEFFKHMKKQGAFILTPEAAKYLKAKISKNLVKSIVKNSNSVEDDFYNIKKDVNKFLTPVSQKRPPKINKTKITEFFDEVRGNAKSLAGLFKKEGAAKKSKFQILKENKIPLTDDERLLVMKRKAVWHNGPHGETQSAVWKSKNPKTGSITYITNTHRAYNTAPTLLGAISRYHKFIKGTA